MNRGVSVPTPAAKKLIQEEISKRLGDAEVDEEKVSIEPTMMDMQNFRQGRLWATRPTQEDLDAEENRLQPYAASVQFFLNDNINGAMTARYWMRRGFSMPGHSLWRNVKSQQHVWNVRVVKLCVEPVSVRKSSSCWLFTFPSVLPYTNTLERSCSSYILWLTWKW